jgi:hypothetical protein
VKGRELKSQTISDMEVQAIRTVGREQVGHLMEILGIYGAAIEIPSAKLRAH